MCNSEGQTRFPGIQPFIGDGWLNSRPEQIFATYCNLKVTEFWLTADVQRVWNPACNADRGQVNGMVRAPMWSSKSNLFVSKYLSTYWLRHSAASGHVSHFSDRLA